MNGWKSGKEKLVGDKKKSIYNQLMSRNSKIKNKTQCKR